MTHLVSPQRRYERSFLSAYPKRKASLGWAQKPRKRMTSRSAAKGLTFWLIDRNRYVGLVQIRIKPTSGIDPKLKNHIYYEIRPSLRRRGYGTQALALALRKARELGLRSVVLVCRRNNGASRKIIVKNGGKLQKAVSVEGHPMPFLKYRINLRAKEKSRETTHGSMCLG